MLQVAPFSLNEAGAALDPLQAPLNPKLALAPGAIVASYERLVAFTLPPAWVSLAFQICVIVCPFAKVQVTVQPLIVVEPVLVMFTFVVKPTFHWLAIA